MSQREAAELRVQLLGPVRAWRGDEELDLGGPRRRAMFGMLAMRVHRPVSRSELIDGVWDPIRHPSQLRWAQTGLLRQRGICL